MCCHVGWVDGNKQTSSSSSGCQVPVTPVYVCVCASVRRCGWGAWVRGCVGGGVSVSPRVHKVYTRSTQKKRKEEKKPI